MFRRYRTYRRIARACRGTLGGHWATLAVIWATLRTYWVSFALASLPTLLAGGVIGFVLYEGQLNKYEVEQRKYRAQARLSVVLARKLEAAESKRERANAAANDLLGKPGWYIVEVRRYREGLFAVEKHEMESCKSYFQRGDELAVEHEPVGKCAELGQHGCHIPAAPATNGEPVLGRYKRTQAVPLEFEGPSRPRGQGSGARQHRVG